MAAVTTFAAVNCSSNWPMAAANVCLRLAVKASLDWVCRLERRSRSLNQFMDVSSSTINPFCLIPHAD